MAEQRRINIDLATVKTEDGEDALSTLGWGEAIDVLEEDDDELKVELTDYFKQADGSLRPVKRKGLLKRFAGSGDERREVTAPRDDVNLLRVDFVDVQQGDGTLIVTPGDKVITVDGGDNQLFARYLAYRYPGTTADEPKEIDAMVVSHGDADHFAGLTEIRKSEDEPDYRAAKRLFIHPKRVFHNGLVKRPSDVREIEMLGETVEVGEDTVITGLEENLLDVPDSQMNEPFRFWKQALAHWTDRGPIEFRRIERGDDEAFDFLSDDGIEVEVLGPITTSVNGKKGLLYLGEPPKGPRIDLPSLTAGRKFSGHSESHTINGHSIVMAVKFGSWRLLFAGDLNEQSESILTKEHEVGDLSLETDVFKVPHHGAADYSPAFLKAVAPVISVVSSGDESDKEYIHPRATLIGALGRHSRDEEPVVWVTEMVAFFDDVGWAYPPKKNGEGDDHDASQFYSFKRAAFGIVKIRTDGERLLAYTNSAMRDFKEAYAWTATAPGEITPAKVLKV